MNLLQCSTQIQEKCELGTEAELASETDVPVSIRLFSTRDFIKIVLANSGNRFSLSYAILFTRSARVLTHMLPSIVNASMLITYTIAMQETHEQIKITNFVH